MASVCLPEGEIYWDEPRESEPEDLLQAVEVAEGLP